MVLVGSKNQEKSRGIFDKLRLSFTRPSFRAEYTLVLVLASVVPTILATAYLTYQMNILIRRQITSYGQEIILQATRNINQLITRTEAAQKQIIYKIVTTRLLRSEKRAYSDSIEYRDLTDFLRNITDVFPFLVDVYIIDSYSAIYSSSAVFSAVLLQEPWIGEAFSTEEGNIVVLPHKNNYRHTLSDSRRDVFSVLKRVTDYTLDPPGVGVVMIDVNYDAVNRILLGPILGGKNSVFIVNENDQIAFHSNKALLGQPLETLEIATGKTRDLMAAEGTYLTGRQVIFRHKLSGIPWSIVGVLALNTLRANVASIIVVSICVVILIILSATVVSVLLARRILTPISQIIHSMHRVGAGDFTQYVSSVRNRDLQLLISVFNQMIDKVNRLTRDIVLREQARNQAELKALQAQVNPHFLYNTLEVIRALALSANGRGVSEIIQSLARLMRYSIDRDCTIVFLSDELESIKNYLRIQKHRRGARFSVEYEIEESLLTCHILRLVLLPVVENAFLHGIERKAGKGLIRISAECAAKSMVIRISDNGCGISLPKLDQLKRLLADGPEEVQLSSGGQADGIGLTNLNRRIKLYHGSSYGITIGSQLRQGTEVSIKLPLIL